MHTSIHTCADDKLIPTHIHTFIHTCAGRSNSKLPSLHLRSTPLSPQSAEKVTISPLQQKRKQVVAAEEGVGVRAGRSEGSQGRA